MSRLLDATHRLDRAVGELLGEEFLLVPVLEQGDFGAKIDESRVGGTFYGHLWLTKEIADMGGLGKNWPGSTANSGAVLKVGVNELPENAEIRINDVIIAKERGDREFKVRLPSQKLGILQIELDDAG